MAAVHIRDIDVAAVKKIEELAKKKEISREEYLRQLIETHAAMGILEDTEEKYQQLVKSVLLLYQENMQGMEVFMRDVMLSLEEIKEMVEGRDGVGQ